MVIKTSLLKVVSWGRGCVTEVIHGYEPQSKLGNDWTAKLRKVLTRTEQAESITEAVHSKRRACIPHTTDLYKPIRLPPNDV